MPKHPSLSRGFQWTRKWQVQSKTHRERFYTVSQGERIILGKPTTVFGCDCPNWKFARKNELTDLKPNCKHIDSTLGQIRVEQKLVIEEQTRLLLDEWAVVELTSMPVLGMQPFEDRTI